jgi:hypothetical protein
LKGGLCEDEGVQQEGTESRRDCEEYDLFGQTVGTGHKAESEYQGHQSPGSEDNAVGCQQGTFLQFA